MATLRDGLGNEELGDNVDTAQKSAQLNITGSVVEGDGRLRSTGAGSPTTFGYGMQAGSAIASDVSVNAVFGTPFAAIPRVVIAASESGTLANASYIGSIEATGFVFFGQSGLIHNYIAVGL